MVFMIKKVIFMLIILSLLFTINAGLFSHEPGKISYTVVDNGRILRIKIYHPVDDPKKHYIDWINFAYGISNNKFIYRKQTNNEFHIADLGLTNEIKALKRISLFIHCTKGNQKWHTIDLSPDINTAQPSHDFGKITYSIVNNGSILRIKIYHPVDDPKKHYIDWINFAYGISNNKFIYREQTNNEFHIADLGLTNEIKTLKRISLFIHCTKGKQMWYVINLP